MNKQLPSTLLLKVDEKHSRFIACHDIIYIFKYGKSTKIALRNGELITVKQDILKNDVSCFSDIFLKISDHTIIQRDAIIAVEKSRKTNYQLVRLLNNEEIEVPHTKIKELMQLH